MLEYFRQTRQFADMATKSRRGWPRPEDDKYYPQRRTAESGVRSIREAPLNVPVQLHWPQW
jgi:hypothetical protein